MWETCRWRSWHHWRVWRLPGILFKAHLIHVIKSAVSHRFHKQLPASFRVPQASDSFWRILKSLWLQTRDVEHQAKVSLQMLVRQWTDEPAHVHVLSSKSVFKGEDWKTFKMNLTHLLTSTQTCTTVWGWIPIQGPLNGVVRGSRKRCSRMRLTPFDYRFIIRPCCPLAGCYVSRSNKIQTNSQRAIVNSNSC